MTTRPPATPRPYDAAKLERLALHYVARYATTRVKLVQYLARKLKEHGWIGDGVPDIQAIAARMTELGYIDDAAFARGRADALLRRGYGERRIDAALRVAGVADEERVRDPAREWEAAIAFARRRRIGPFATAATDRAGIARAVGAMLRGGHDMAVARLIAAAGPGAVPERPD